MYVIYLTLSAPIRPRSPETRFLLQRSATSKGKRCSSLQGFFLFVMIYFSGKNMLPDAQRVCTARSLRCSIQTRRMHLHCYPQTQRWASARDTNRTRLGWAWRRCANGNGHRFQIQHATTPLFSIIGSVSVMIPQIIHLPSLINS